MLGGLLYILRTPEKVIDMRPIIENKSYWDKSNDELGYIAWDAKQAMDINPDCLTALKWADQVNDACTVMNYRNLWNSKHDYKRAVNND